MIDHQQVEPGLGLAGDPEVEPKEPEAELPQIRPDDDEVSADGQEEPLPLSVGQYSIGGRVCAHERFVIYSARAEEPAGPVLLAVVEPEVADGQPIRRFELDSPRLESLQHPGVAPVVEAGAADGGEGIQPFLAWEAPPGRPISDIEGDLAHRTQLLADACDAVHHLHVRGLVHRGLRPGAIIVDDEDCVRIIETGLASVTNHDLESAGAGGEHLDRLRCLSPEQVEGNEVRVDARADIYALGAIAFRVLTGQDLWAQRDTGTLTEAIRRQDARTALDVDPDLGSNMSDILSKAVSRDPAARFQSAAELGQALRGLAVVEGPQDKEVGDEFERVSLIGDGPVEASTFAQDVADLTTRRPTLVIGVGATIGFLFLIVLVQLTHVGERARLRTELESARSSASAAAATHQGEIESASASLDSQRRAAEFLASTLTGLDADLAAVRDTQLISAALDRAAVGAADLPDDARMPVETALGLARWRIGEPFAAERHLREAIKLGSASDTVEESATVAAMAHLGGLLADQGRVDEAITTLRQAVARSRSGTGLENREALMAMRVLGETLSETDLGESEETLTEALSIAHRSLPKDDADTLSIALATAKARVALGQKDEARQLLEEAASVAADAHGPEAAISLAIDEQLASMLLDGGDTEDAVELLAKVSRARNQVLGPAHPVTMRTVSLLAVARHAAGQHSEADQLLAATLGAARASYGDDHPQTIRAAARLVASFRESERFDEAITLGRDALRDARRVIGEHAEVTLDLTEILIGLFSDMRLFEEAEPLAVQLHESMVHRDGPDAPSARRSGEMLVELYERWGRVTDAAEWREKLGT